MEDKQRDYEFSYEVDSYTHTLTEEPLFLVTEDTVPVEIFSHASTMQALSRYLVDNKGTSFTDVGKLLGRSPKSIWASYHQTQPLPKLTKETIQVPLHIFSTQLAPLEALVLFLKSLSLKNVEIARILDLDPRTTHTAAKRGEVKQ